jgi:hypothetical protein
MPAAPVLNPTKQRPEGGGAPVRAPPPPERHWTFHWTVAGSRYRNTLPTNPARSRAARPGYWCRSVGRSITPYHAKERVLGW